MNDSKMAAMEVKNLLSRAWQEQWNAENWTLEVSQKTQNLNYELLKEFISQLTGYIVQYALSSPVDNGIYLSYLKDGLATEQLCSANVIDCICKKTSSNQNINELPIALNILEYSLTFIRKSRSENDSLELAVSLAELLCWLFGVIATLLKTTFELSKNAVKDVTIELRFNICDKCFELISRLMDNHAIQSLSLIGKLEIKAEQEEMIQTNLNELMQLSADLINDQSISLQYERNLKALMNVATRFFNSTFNGVTLQSRKPGHVPSHSLQTLVEIQVIENFFMDSSLMMDIFDSVLRSENIPMDQFYVDLLRCGCHGILNASSSQEELLWTSFFFFKIPSIVNRLKTKYRQTGLDNAVFITACIQFAKMNILLDDLDVHCRFQCLPSFLAQCQQKGLMDSGKVDQILSNRKQTNDLFDTSIKSDRNPVGNVLNAGLLVTEGLKVLSLPLEENKDVIKQQLTQLSNSVELGRQLAAAAGMDVLSNFLDLLISLNEKAKGPITEPNEDPNFAEVRADVFNCSFLLLSYTTAVFGIKVLSLVSNKDAFFVTWRLHCSQDVGQKCYSPMALEMILDQVMTNNTSNINAVLAKWDDYCLCAGAVINELTQALACSVILVDKIQRVCETFKNKRPALSICASAWLCTQYTTMTANKRDMIIKILRAFRGQKSQKPARSEYIARIIEDLAGTVDLEPPVLIKGKPGCKPEPHRNPSDMIDMSQVLKTMTKFPGSPCVDKKSLNQLKKHLELLSPNGFCKILVLSILQAGKIDETSSFEILASSLMMLDPIKLCRSLTGEALPSILKRCDAFKLLSDPQGKTLARFISKSITYALIASKHKNLEDFQRPSIISKLDVESYTEVKPNDQIVESLVTLLDEILITLKWQQSGSVALFLKSLLEQLSLTTMHLSPSLRLSQQFGVKLSRSLHGSISNEVLMLICNLDDVKGRQELAYRICNSFADGSNLK